MSKLISRREPVIVLKPFRYLGRRYQEGSNLDRRRVRMPQRKLHRLLVDKFVILAKDLTSNELAEYGFQYDKQYRYPLQSLCIPDQDLITEGTSLDSENTDEGQNIDQDIENQEETTETPEPIIEHIGGGWYNVLISDEVVNEKKLQKKDIESFLSTLKDDDNQ